MNILFANDGLKNLKKVDCYGLKVLYLYHKFGFITMIEDDKMAQIKFKINPL